MRNNYLNYAYFIVLFLMFPSITNGDKHCNEQQLCSSSASEWCCPYNTTCGDQNTCNKIKQGRAQSDCPDRVMCFTETFYWCCDHDKKCGNSGECEDENVSTMIIITIICVVCFVIFLPICIMCIHRQSSRDNNTNQDLLPPFDSLTNNPIYSNSMEEPPPSYSTAVLSLTTTNQNKF